LKLKKLPKIQIKPPKTLRQTKTAGNFAADKTAGNIIRYFFAAV
jgi:hypothetical protein